MIAQVLNGEAKKLSAFPELSLRCRPARTTIGVLTEQLVTVQMSWYYHQAAYNMLFLCYDGKIPRSLSSKSSVRRTTSNGSSAGRSIRANEERVTHSLSHARHFCRRHCQILCNELLPTRQIKIMTSRRNYKYFTCCYQRAHTHRREYRHHRRRYGAVTRHFNR